MNVLIQNGAKVNAVDKDNWTALRVAAENGHVDVAKLFIQYGVDVNAVDNEERTALHFAARNGHVDVSKVLIQNGVDVNAAKKDQNGTRYCQERDVQTLHTSTAVLWCSFLR